MNKNELKQILKPLIKECIKEVIFEDGTLSSIVSEVAKGMGQQTIVETKQRFPTKKKPQYETILKGLSLNKKCSALRFKLIQVCLELSEDSRLALNRDKETDFLTQAFEEILVQHQDQGGLKEAPHDHDFLKLLQEIAWRLDQEEKVELSENEVHERRLQDGTILTSVRAQMLLSTFFV